MNPDLEKRVPREILAELIEEGTEAFRGYYQVKWNSWVLEAKSVGDRT